MASFLLLGPLEVRASGAPVPIRGSRQRIVLALLLLRAGSVIPSERLVTAVWDDEPPTTARAQVQTSISKLRAFLASLDCPEAIVTHESGYQIRIPSEQLDVAQFDALVARGREAARRLDTAAAVASLRDALGLWRGDAVAGVRSRLVRAVAMRLDEQRLAVTEECVDLELALGRHREVIGELRDLVDAHPLREKFYGQLMLALYRDGRQADALEVFRRARTILLEEQGLDPSEALRTLERAILESDPAVDYRPAGADTVRPSVPPPLASSSPSQPPAASLSEPSAASPPRPAAAHPASRPGQAVPERARPRQLPARARGFVGRAEARRELRQALSEPSSAPVVLLTGPAGVGKTALAVETAHEVSAYFPDGHVYAHLRGGDPPLVPPEQVLGDFLRALGVPPAALPSDRDSLAALYRDRLAGQRVLVLLDDAASAWQVAPLLPGGEGVALLVTSRGLLPGLPNARRFELGALPPAASLELLTQAVGAQRVAAEPQAAAAVAAACGHLPLALQIAAAKLSARGHWRIARMASRLSDESRRLDELSLDGAGVRASIAVSLEALSAPARRLLLLLGSLGAVDFASWVAGPLLAVDAHDGADVLDELVDARLAEVQVGTGAEARYRLHDLVGVFARELLPAEVCAPDRLAAHHRLLCCWLCLAGQAHRRQYGGDFTVPRLSAQVWPLPADLIDELLIDPIRWFDVERANLIAAVRLAADLDYHELCCELAVTAVTFFEARAHREDWRETHELALAAAVRHQDQRAEAAVRCSRAGLALVEQRFAEAQSDLRAALAFSERTGDSHGRGLARRGLGSIDRLQGRPESARQHYEQALADLRASGDLVGEAHVLINLALCAGPGEPGHAEQLLRQAHGICAGLGVRRVAAQARYRLGQLYLAQRELARAESEFSAVLGSVTTVEDPVGKAYAMIGIGSVRLAAGDWEQAEEALAEALTQMRRAGSRIGEGRALVVLAECRILAQDLAGAGDQLATAEVAFAGIGAADELARVVSLRRRLAAG